MGVNLFLTALGALLSDNAYPLVTKDTDTEDCDAATVDEPHRLHRQHRRDDVVRVMFPPRHGHQSVS